MDNLSFESALARLEQIVKQLEDGKAPLDETLKLFEEGSALVKLCTARIEAAEQTVKKTVSTPDGGVELQKFE